VIASSDSNVRFLPIVRRAPGMQSGLDPRTRLIVRMVMEPGGSRATSTRCSANYSSRSNCDGIPNLDQVMLGASEEPNLSLYTLVKRIVGRLLR
jgi:hypothetical protein